MPPRSKIRETASAGNADGHDKISALPDDVLHHVLSFVPTREAVKTCVLSRRWRHLWQSMRSLRFLRGGSQETEEQFFQFVNHLLLLRDPSAPLDSCVFRAELVDSPYVNLWIRRCLLCHVRVLDISVYDVMERFELPDLRLSSRHLKELKLTNLGLHGSFLDFSNCPELEDLEIDDCIITADRILCPFVKRLKFYISFFHSDVRTPRIYVPSLISLNLDHSGMSPLLDSMPSLVTAFVQFRTAHERYRPVTAGNDEGEYLIFEGLSNTTHLKLVSTHYDVIFRRDSTRRPLFRKLKTLFVKCVEADLRTLVFFLQHSPILEKLTLHCYSVIEDNLDIEGSCGTKEELFASKHLKIVEIKCPKFSQTTQKITKILSTYGIPLGQINIRETS